MRTEQEAEIVARGLDMEVLREAHKRYLHVTVDQWTADRLAGMNAILAEEIKKACGEQIKATVARVTSAEIEAMVRKIAHEAVESMRDRIQALVSAYLDKHLEGFVTSRIGQAMDQAMADVRRRILGR